MWQVWREYHSWFTSWVAKIALFVIIHNHRYKLLYFQINVQWWKRPLISLLHGVATQNLPQVLVLLHHFELLLSEHRRQAIIWTNAGILLIGPLGTNFSEVRIKIWNFSFMKMHLKMSSARMAAIFPGGDELKVIAVMSLLCKDGILLWSQSLMNLDFLSPDTQHLAWRNCIFIHIIMDFLGALSSFVALCVENPHPHPYHDGLQVISLCVDCHLCGETTVKQLGLGHGMVEGMIYHWTEQRQNILAITTLAPWLTKLDSVD